MNGVETSAKYPASDDDRARMDDANRSDLAATMSDGEALLQRCRIQAKVLGALEKMVQSGIVTATNQSNMRLLDRLVTIGHQFTDAQSYTPLPCANDERGSSKESGAFKCPVCRVAIPAFQGTGICPNCGVAVVSFGQSDRSAVGDEQTDESATNRDSATRRSAKTLTEISR